MRVKLCLVLNTFWILSNICRNCYGLIPTQAYLKSPSMFPTKTFNFIPSSGSLTAPTTTTSFIIATAFVGKNQYSNVPSLFPTMHNVAKRQTRLSMSYDDNNDGPAFLTVAGVLLAIVILVGTSLVPTMDMMNGSGSSMDYNLADSVVTRQSSPSNEKLKDYSNPSDKLSRSKIQEKLNRVPVFYLADSDANMKDRIFLSFQDANDAASSSNLQVKCTTLDQVMYPLLFKRGRMRMAPPPVEVQKVEQILFDDPSKSSDYKFHLVPSKAAIKDAESLDLPLNGDIPLFVADRLAFASDEGPQVPLFFEKNDCVTSYDRLRKAGRNKLPEEPTIRTTTLFDVIKSMETGSRPAVKQLQFYATADDLLRASEML